ncbi:MAG TPA: TonB-dependent receptor [Candidatus Limnocylindrales bacterium]|nr:TonB-dependent receptor [Candidatus Limnocylindrales bacterium]
MNHWKTVGRAFCIACMLIFLTANLVAAQNAGGILRGQVTDPSGGAVAGATVLLTTPSGAAMDTVTNKEGIYEFKDLAEGSYEIKSIAQGFSMFTKSGVAVTAGQITRVNIQLSLEEQKEKVEVNSTTTQVDVNPAGNANTVVLQGKDLEALSDDPDELQSELQALAGPSAGPNGGQIYIDGFTAGQLPPKASIREIRINQNPFSSEYDRLGYGRIEIFTKPGTDKLHGQVMFSGNASSFNSRNPFELLPQGTQPPSYHTTYFSGNVGGALSKKASYFFNLENRDIQNLGIVSATVLDASNNIVPYSAAVSNPEMRTNLSPRLDYQLTPNNTLSARYQYWHNTETNSEVGQFTLQALGTKNHSAEHTVQATDTQVIGAHVINESRFQYVHDSSENTPTNTSTTISVGGAFTGNGSGMGGNSSDLQNRIEFQNTTYMNYGKHSWKFGGRIRSTRDVTTNLNNYNGSFFFSNIDQYQQFVEQVAGITPTYYTQTAGKSSFDVNWLDAGLFAQDDWKLRANFTVSYGLRFETQNDFSDKADFAPRLGFAWGIGGTPKNPPKTILRAGFGLFYDRFNYNQVLQQERQGGTSQQGYQVAYQIVNPAFQISDAPLPPAQLTSSTTATIYEPNLSLHAPYTVQTGVTLERQLTKVANLAVTYLNSRGVHQFFTDNLNAYNPVLDQRPQSLDENIFQYQSEGTFKQNQLILNSSIRMGTKLFLFGFYTLNYADSDTSGAGSLASVPGHVQMDYGRASFDVRHRLFMGGTIGMPYGFRFSPFLVASSGIPFNITTGNDPYQSSTFNSRPEFATGACTGLGYTSTKYGCMFTPTTPQDFQSYVPIPVNIAEAPGRFALNFRLSKTFGFGPVLEGSGGAGGGGPMGGGTFGRPGGGGPGRGGPGGGRGMDAGATNKRYALTFSVNVRNAFNNVNLGTPIGNIQSPIFGESNSLAGGPFNTQSANRRIDLQVTFAF